MPTAARIPIRRIVTGAISVAGVIVVIIREVGP
jgi:hypothetical protein